MSLSLIVPTFGGNVANIQRTIDSCKDICDDVVIISTAFFRDDQFPLHQLGHKVVDLPFNYVFKNGFGEYHNQGTEHAKNDWLLLLGVGETFAEAHKDVHQALRDATCDKVFRCNHVNDQHTWKRIWNRKGGTKWGGLIHEEIGGGSDGGLLFRMQDTEKVPQPSHLENECLRWMKALLYNCMYRRLASNPHELSYTNEGWLKFVAGASESIHGFCEENRDMILSCMTGDYLGFIKQVENKIEAGRKANGCNFKPTGT
jgi:hypothetical protein